MQQELLQGRPTTFKHASAVDVNYQKLWEIRNRWVLRWLLNVETSSCRCCNELAQLVHHYSLFESRCLTCKSGQICSLILFSLIFGEEWHCGHNGCNKPEKGVWRYPI